MKQILYEAGIIAIPLKDDENFNDAQPNYLVVNNQFGKEKNHTFELLDGTTVVTNAAYLDIKFVSRSLYADETLQEMVFPFPNQIEKLPYSFLYLLDDYDVIKNDLETANMILSLFKFRNGNRLEGLKLEIDEEVLDDIIDDLKNRKIIDHLNTLNYKEDIEYYLETLELELETFLEYPEFKYNDKPNVT